METTQSGFKAKLWNVFATYGCAWLWVSFFIVTLGVVASAGTIHVPFLSVVLSKPGLLPAAAMELVAGPTGAVMLALVFAPLVEEVLFRMLPLTITMVLVRLLPEPYRKTIGKNLVTAVIIGVCGIGFGLAHGHPVNVFIQGFVGFMLGILYLKNGRSMFASYFSCVFVHAAYNFSVITAALVT